MNYRQAAAVAHLQALAGRGAQATRDESPETLALIQDEKIADLALTENPLHVLRQGHRVRLAAILLVGAAVVGVQVVTRAGEAPTPDQNVLAELEALREDVDFIRDTLRRSLGGTKTIIPDETE